ncbi:MAG: hypothetical protein IT269_12565 [Saprospiraceae bacterium]|nr:hypothetical protein [Saprospiraceae bacterium]
MLIKASHIRNLTDARYFAAREVDFLGFCLQEGHPDYLDPMYMKAMREWVQGPKIVGEFPSAEAAYVMEAARFLELDAVETAAEVAFPDAGFEAEKTIIRHFNVGKTDENALFERVLNLVLPENHLLLLNFEHSDWHWPMLLDDPRWRECCRRQRVMLQIDAPADIYPRLYERLEPAGFSFAGGEEEKVGVKSFDELDEVLDALM